jgi:predicted Zn-dependent protease
MPQYPAMKYFLIKLTLTLAIFHLAISCAINPVTGKKQLMFLTEDQEKALGLQSDPEIIATMGLYENPELQAFINEMGVKMGAISHRSNLTYEFKIVDSPVVNAFAVPGGYVYFTRGIMAHFNNEAEFAGVLGHEIGHIAARHSAQQYTNQILVQGGLILGVLVSEDFRDFANVAQLGLNLLLLKFGRDHESQSDRLGVEYSTKIGYDAREMAGFFKTIHRLSDSEEGRIPTFLSTHPDPLDRFQSVEAMAMESQAKQPGSYAVGRETYLRKIEGLVYGHDPNQGFVEQGIFYHPQLKFRFPVPASWVVENTPAQVQMAPKDGKALLLLGFSQANTLSDAALALIQKENLTVIENRRTQVNNLPAQFMLAEQFKASDSTRLSVTAQWVEYNGNIYEFIGLTNQKDYSTYKPAFENTMRSFNTLTDPSKLNVKAEKIRIKTAERSGTLGDLLTEWKMPPDRFKELAILNGMELSDVVVSGTLIKTIGF